MLSKIVLRLAHCLADPSMQQIGNQILNTCQSNFQHAKHVPKKRLHFMSSKSGHLGNAIEKSIDVINSFGCLNTLKISFVDACCNVPFAWVLS